MTTQHVVALDGVRLTRLPVGRAEGYVWLSFVARGPAIRLLEDPDDYWSVSDHVRIRWTHGDPVRTHGASGGGGDRMSEHHLMIVDDGHESLTLTYLQDGDEVEKETVDLPAGPGTVPRTPLTRDHAEGLAVTIRDDLARAEPPYEVTIDQDDPDDSTAVELRRGTPGPFDEVHRVYDEADWAWLRGRLVD